MNTYPPEAPQSPPEPPPDPARQVDLAALVNGAPAVPAPEPVAADDQVRAWSAVILVLLVLGSASAMLITGHAVNEALLLSGGVTLLGVAIARRILTAGGLLPTIAIAGAVTAFAVILLISGHEISDVAMISGGAGLVAGEVTAWALRPPAARRGV